MAISRALRFEILRRDDHACIYCGGRAPDVKLTVDHIIPVALGGQDNAANLVTACAECNAGKGKTMPGSPHVAQVDERNIAWRAALDQAAAESLVKPDGEGDMLAAAREAFGAWRDFTPAEEDSLRTVFRRGLPAQTIAEAMRIAFHNDNLPDRSTFRYAMGVCWNRLRAIEERAEQIIQANRAEGTE